MTLSVEISHRFPGFGLDVAFEAPPGVTALFGRSGCGKTTVINAVAGLLRPERGRIVLDGQSLLDTAGRHFLPPHRRRIGYVFQDARLFPHLTVRQNLLYGRWFASRREGANMQDILDLLGIEPLLDRRPAGLSGGERQRVAIGRAILSNPRLLLMDEPLAALDEGRKAEILPYLERLRDRLGLPILLVSHSVAEVARLATTVVVMEAGRVRLTGPAAQVLSDPAAARLIGMREAGALLTARVGAREADGLVRLDCAAGPLWLPEAPAAAGERVRLRVLAQDVMLALARPEAISALNVLPATVQEVICGEGHDALVRLDVGGEPLLSRITGRSAAALALGSGTPVFAVLKSVAVAPENVSGV